MIGEFYLALPHYSPNGTDYKSDHRSIWIFNMDIDRKYFLIHLIYISYTL